MPPAAALGWAATARVVIKLIRRRGRRQIDSEEISAFHRHLDFFGMAGTKSRRLLA
ncbi:MAG: hypothetical protein MZV70_29975 [Desulfobacterales bacterium]|nr:hypothetical protein [Desulfobacterales bacterium]